MDIRNRLYPYPVLSENTDDYIDSSFSIDKVDVRKGIGEIEFSVNLTLNNDGIKELLDSNHAEIVVHIECSQTCFRTLIRNTEMNITHKVREHFLNGKVSLCVFIIAKSDLKGYTNISLNEDYEGMTFDMNRGSILAIGGQVNVDIIKEVEELSKIPSIFSICRCAEDTDESMKIDICGEKIAITLCNDSFQNYKIIAENPRMIPVFHSMVIIPALIYAFETLKHEDLDSYSDLRWYKAINRTLQKYNLMLNKETLENIPSYEIAQKLLDLPLNKAFNTLVLDDTSDEEEE